MRITPGESWTWSYRSIEGQDYLGLFITNEKGMKYFFRTNFMVQHLRTFPEYGSPFTVRDAQLLNDFMAGLMAVGIADNDQGKDVSTSMEIALNAVACALFVRAPKRAIEHAFLPYPGNIDHIKRGQVISLYSKDKKVSDFIVLDDESQVTDGTFRVMFANRELRIGKHMLSVGALIRVPRSVICPFRALSSNNSNHISYA